MMIRELLHVGPQDSPAFGVLVIASLFRDSMPWLYELGIELYRVAKKGNSVEIEQAGRAFRQAVEFAAHGPLSREFFGRSKDMYMLIEEIDPLLDRALSMITDEARPSRKKTKKDTDEVA
jgi:hypothetical protein